MQFDTVLGWYAEFLRKHPTETIILDVQYESESGNGEAARTSAMPAASP